MNFLYLMREDAPSKFTCGWVERNPGSKFIFDTFASMKTQYTSSGVFIPKCEFYALLVTSKGSQILSAVNANKQQAEQVFQMFLGSVR